MANISAVCDTCNPEIDAEFNPASGARTVEVIAGDLFVSDRCFVRDEIRFLNTGRLIFVPRRKQEYHDEYFVFCRKLVVVGGHAPGQLFPCGPDTPGTSYQANNVIIWQDRLQAAASGAPPSPSSAADGTSHNRNSWSSSSNPNGNNGAHGGAGADGAKGNQGSTSRNAPNLTLVALEVEVGVGDHLTIDFDGQVGGDGSSGQNGGDGGHGMGGRIGKSDTTWPGTGCDRQPGHGGNGGNGGAGGEGGDGGDGGNGGDIQIWSTKENITTGAFAGGKITYVNDGGTGGDGGIGGRGGFRGLGGRAGFPTSECNDASDGPDGAEGEPQTLEGRAFIKGAVGAHGSPASLKMDELTEGTCADLLPMKIEVDPSGLQPPSYCRGFSAPATGDGTITGNHLAQVDGVSLSLSGVTATVKLTSTDSQLDLFFNIAGNSATGQGDLVFSRVFGPDETLSNAIEVNRFEVTSIAPNSGARGADVNVTITGQCFDPSALLQNVVVSGIGVTVVNVLVVNETTVQCVFQIGNLAPLSARDVTVQTGIMQHTLVNGFTVTS
jgi:hypothetical protein